MHTKNDKLTIIHPIPIEKESSFFSPLLSLLLIQMLYDSCFNFRWVRELQKLIYPEFSRPFTVPQIPPCI